MYRIKIDNALMPEINKQLLISRVNIEDNISIIVLLHSTNSTKQYLLSPLLNLGNGKRYKNAGGALKNLNADKGFLS